MSVRSASMDCVSFELNGQPPEKQLIILLGQIGIERSHWKQNRAKNVYLKRLPLEPASVWLPLENIRLMCRTSRRPLVEGINWLVFLLMEPPDCLLMNLAEVRKKLSLLLVVANRCRTAGYDSASRKVKRHLLFCWACRLSVKQLVSQSVRCKGWSSSSQADAALFTFPSGQPINQTILCTHKAARSAASAAAEAQKPADIILRIMRSRIALCCLSAASRESILSNGSHRWIPQGLRLERRIARLAFNWSQNYELLLVLLLMLMLLVWPTRSIRLESQNFIVIVWVKKLKHIRAWSPFVDRRQVSWAKMDSEECKQDEQSRELHHLWLIME